MMATDRLFAVEATAHERGVRRRANLRAQGSMFDAPETAPWSCPACGGGRVDGERKRCSCATSGAQALALALEHPPSSTPGRYTLEQIHDETLYAPSAADWRPTRPNPCPRDTTHPAHAGPCDTPRCPYCAHADGLHTGPGATAPFAATHPGFCHQSHHNADDDTWTPCSCPGWLYWPAEHDDGGRWPWTLEGAPDEHDAAPLTHHEALAIAAERCVSMFDVLTIHRGGTYKEMHTRTTTPGWAGGETFGSSDANAIEVGRGHYCDSPTVKIRWSEIADVIRAGITPEQIAEALDAADQWRDLNSKPHNFSKRDDKTRAEADAFYERYSAITGRFRAVERAVTARGLEALAPTPTLL